MQTIKELLARKGSDVYSIDSQTTVYRAIEAMDEKNVGALVVIDHGQLVGVLTERDCVRKMDLKGRQSRDTRVTQIMTSPVACASPEQTIEECMALAEQSGAQRDRGAEAARDAAKGTAIGATSGAVAGAIFSSAGRGAAAGAAGGAAASLLRTMFRSREPDPLQQRFVETCLRERGYQPIGWK